MKSAMVFRPRLRSTAKDVVSYIKKNDYLALAVG